MNVAKKPAIRCQSMWQWNAQTRAESQSAKVVGTNEGTGDSYLDCLL